MNRLFRYPLLAAAVMGVLSPSVAYAYVDPGTAGFIVTTVLGFLAAVGYTVRSSLHRLKRWMLWWRKPDTRDDGENGRNGNKPPR